MRPLPPSASKPGLCRPFGLLVLSLLAGCGTAVPAGPAAGPAAPAPVEGWLCVAPELDSGVVGVTLSLYRHGDDGGPDRLVASRNVSPPFGAPVRFGGLTPGTGYRLTATGRTDTPTAPAVTELRFDLPATSLTLTVPVRVTTGPDHGLTVTNGTIVDTDAPERID